MPVHGTLRRVLVTAMIPLAVGAVCFAAVSFWVVSAVKSHPAYAAALAAVRAEPAVIAALGTPLEAGFWAQGGGDEAAGRFEAMFSVSGPRGDAGVRLLARADGPAWELVFLDVGANLPGGRQKVFVLRNDELPVRFGVQRDALAAPADAPADDPPR
ncbi:cytochrome c oxidase assembly factor Coa1 family protein [Phycisphaera mikurensis]|uniref:cytochrome c oxidase assembly factor Coa1 family protein n=1 Tax=Phycisphaera mikurensis TaxID=547188 RepID=UPI00059D103E|nr:cytochrome c oxidase assembly factor Coa1 family protein [Phycisphaera mikurensis]MBB6442996.1 hypothetical protein [Phycisphaera mikurensis]